MELHAHDHVKGLFDTLVSDGYDGRDFYDAYVRYESITCVEVKTRS